jgi:protein-tyrosine phosphatase
LPESLYRVIESNPCNKRFQVRNFLGKVLLGFAILLAMANSPAFAVEVLKVLFVDTGNTGRSISAETLARIHAASHHLDVVFISRGLDMDPFDRRVELNAQILWQRRGIDLSGHRAEQLAAQDVKHADLILTLTAKHKDRLLGAYPDAKDKVFVLAEYATGASADIEDAWGKPIDVYERMLSALDGLVPAAVDKAATAGQAKRSP